MDAFQLLSRGATIKPKHRTEIKKLSSDSADSQSSDNLHLNFFTPVKSKTSAGHLKSSRVSKAEISSNVRTKITGHDAPEPVEDFSNLDVISKRVANYGFTKPSPIQSHAIPALMADRDLLACAPTGSGKTLAFVAPILARLAASPARDRERVRALVVAPTRELVQQTYELASTLSKGLSGVSVALLDKQFLAKLAKGAIVPDFLISTPRRLVESLHEGSITLSRVQMLVLDEADRLLGDEFVAQTDEIIAACSSSKLTKAVFSATLPANIEELAQSIMTNPLRVIVGHKEAAADTIEQKLLFCGTEAGKVTAIRQLLKSGDVVPPILVFVQSIARAKALFHELIYDKVNVDVIHSELTQKQRDKAIASFKQGDVWVLICTDVLARGVDFQGVRLVINYDIPLTAQAYVHRIGRTGRAGKKGRALTFFTKLDADTIRPIANVMKQSGCDVPSWLLQGKSKSHSKIPMARDEISTVPKVVKRKRNERQQMIEASKKRSSHPNASTNE